MIFITLGWILITLSKPLQELKVNNNQTYFFEGKIKEVNRGKGEWDQALLTVNAIEINDKWQRVNEVILLNVEKRFGILERGDLILVKSNIVEIQNRNNPGEFNAELYWSSKGVERSAFAFEENVWMIDVGSPSFFDQTINASRKFANTQLEKFLSGQELAIMKAMILGEKNYLDEDTKAAFSGAGAMHVLAVSGLHIGILVYILNFLFKHVFTKAGYRTAIIIMVLFLWFYAGVTAFSASVTRSVFMFSLLMLGKLSWRKSNSLNILCFSAFILLLYHPKYILDIGFQLSYLAMFGILIVYPILKDVWMPRSKYLRIAWEGILVGLAAQLFTVPLTLYYFHQFPNYFLLTNLLLILISGVIMIAGIGLISFGVIPFINQLFGWITFFSVWLMLKGIHFIDGLPASKSLGYFLDGVDLGILSVLILGLTIFIIKKKRIGILGFGLLAILLVQTTRIEAYSKEEFRILNSNNFVSVLRVGGQNQCFYLGNDQKKEKARKLMVDYQKVFPGQCTFYAINNAEIDVNFERNRLQFSTEKERLLIQLNHQKLAVILSNKYKVLPSIDEKVVLMPYVINEGKVSEKLKEGSLALTLN